MKKIAVMFCMGMTLISAVIMLGCMMNGWVIGAVINAIGTAVWLFNLWQTAK